MYVVHPSYQKLLFNKFLDKTNGWGQPIAIILHTRYVIVLIEDISAYNKQIVLEIRVCYKRVRMYVLVYCVYLTVHSVIVC